MNSFETTVFHLLAHFLLWVLMILIILLRIKLENVMYAKKDIFEKTYKEVE